MKYALLDETKRILSVSDTEIEGTLELETLVQVSDEDAEIFSSTKVEEVYQAQDGNEVVYIRTTEPLFYVDGQILTLSKKNWIESPDRVKEAHREMRNKLLAESDWTQVFDTPLSSEAKGAWAMYRQKLRNLDSLINENGKLSFPEKP
tara:strand:+ start:1525 stop:1968 length:444 start_codon:yes stop_codon:yes gene_type:complete